MASVREELINGLLSLGYPIRLVYRWDNARHRPSSKRPAQTRPVDNSDLLQAIQKLNQRGINPSVVQLAREVSGDDSIVANQVENMRLAGLISVRRKEKGARLQIYLPK